MWSVEYGWTKNKYPSKGHKNTKNLGVFMIDPTFLLDISIMFPRLVLSAKSVEGGYFARK